MTKIVKNEKLIRRNGRIGQYTSFAALAVLGVGMYISISRQDLFAYAIGALVLGFVLTQIGMSFSTRYGRSPRPDEQVDAALKGLPGDTTVYHYTTPVPHLLVGPAGIWILQVYHQRGKVVFSRNRWRISGGGFMQAYMSIFGQEGIGRPELDIANETSVLRKHLSKHMSEAEIPEIQAALVFTNDQSDVTEADGPMPAMKAKQLKDFIRQKSKDRSLAPLALEQVRSALDGQSQTSD